MTASFHTLIATKHFFPSSPVNKSWFVSPGNLRAWPTPSARAVSLSHGGFPPPGHKIFRRTIRNQDLHGTFNQATACGPVCWSRGMEWRKACPKGLVKESKLGWKGARLAAGRSRSRGEGGDRRAGHRRWQKQHYCRPTARRCAHITLGLGSKWHSPVASASSAGEIGSLFGSASCTGSFGSNFPAIDSSDLGPNAR